MPSRAKPTSKPPKKKSSGLLTLGLPHSQTNFWTARAGVPPPVRGCRRPCGGAAARAGVPPLYMQVPNAHVCNLPQACPHSLQLAGSLSSDVQTSPHIVQRYHSGQR